jgi:hypothetical protein
MSEKLTMSEAAQLCKRVGLAITGLPQRRAKLPTTKMGGLADDLHRLRELRLHVQKVADAIKAEETRITDHIIDNVDMDKERGVMGVGYKAMIKREDVPVVEDWDAFYAHVKKKGAFHFLTKALNRSAITDAMENSKAGVPGIGTFSAKKISLTKV